MYTHYLCEPQTKSERQASREERQVLGVTAWHDKKRLQRHVSLMTNAAVMQEEVYRKITSTPRQQRPQLKK